MSEIDITRVRLVKVDCEGAELLVLSGATDILHRRIVDFWVVDYHENISGPKNCERAHGPLSDAGYQLGKHKELCIYFDPVQQRELQTLGEYRVVKSWRE